MMVLVSILCVLLLYCFFNLIRNDHVFDVRVWFLYNDRKAYDCLPSYEFMLLCRPWIWGRKAWKKFLNNREAQT